MAQTKITLEQVRHVARLARLQWSPEDEERLRADMDAMLAYVDKLNELDTKDVAPTTQVGEAGTPMREDEVTNRPEADAMIANAVHDLQTQANPAADPTGLLKRYPKANVRVFDGNPGSITEMDALVAYLGMLGTLVDFKLYDDKANLR